VIDLNEIKQRVYFYKHQLGEEEQELTDTQEEELRNIHSALEDNSSPEAIDLKDLVSMILDRNSRGKEKRRAP